MKTILIDVSLTEVGDEVIDLAYVKSFSSISTTIHDSLLTNLIKSCRAEIEKLAGISIIEKEIVAEYECINESALLPFSPIGDIISVEIDSIATNNYTLKGLKNKRLYGNFPNGAVVTYNAGFGANCPEDLKLCIAKFVLETFENRVGILSGSNNLLPNNWRSVALNYRPTWIAL